LDCDALGAGVRAVLQERAAFPPDVSSVADARQFVQAGLDLAGCEDDAIDAAVLLVSELATNAVVHAASPYAVEYCHADRGVTVEVSDVGPGTPAIRAPQEIGGNGLRLVDALSESWGVRAEAPGKSVFFRLPC
jgi:anti-sigma regulatory factor (Ser/Thr protein kinase)